MFNDPVRGSLLNGKIDQHTQLAPTVLTKVRRLRGSVNNANITNATVIMLNGQAVVTSGHLMSGNFFGENTSFGTTINTTFFKINIHEVNHCFSSGIVGSRGQLNWKEVVKNWNTVRFLPHLKFKVEAIVFHTLEL